MLQGVKYHKIKVTSKMRSDAIKWAKVVYDKSHMIWRDAMKAGWRLMWWHMLRNLRRDHVVHFMFRRKPHTVSPTKPLLSHRIISNNRTLMNLAGAKFGRLSSVSGNNNEIEKWYVVLIEYDHKGNYKKPMAVRFDSVEKIYGYYEASDVVANAMTKAHQETLTLV